MRYCVTGLSFLFALLSSCGALRNQQPDRTVPIAIQVSTDAHQLNSVNMHVYALKVADILDDFNVVNLSLSDADTASVILNISIENFNAFPPEQRVSRRTFRRNIAVGTDQAGRTVYQTAIATADIVQTRVRTNALFNVSMLIKGQPATNYKRTFNESLNIDQLYVANIQGDTRAVDPSVYSLTMPPMQPITDEVLLALSNKDMLSRLSREIRTHYSRTTN
jgi:hypothetical protein